MAGKQPYYVVYSETCEGSVMFVGIYRTARSAWAALVETQKGQSPMTDEACVATFTGAGQAPREVQSMPEFATGHAFAFPAQKQYDVILCAASGHGDATLIWSGRVIATSQAEAEKRVMLNYWPDRIDSVCSPRVFATLVAGE